MHIYAWGYKLVYYNITSSNLLLELKIWKEILQEETVQIDVLKLYYKKTGFIFS